MVVEFTEGKTLLHDASRGVITNAPNDDWHIANLGNYLNLSPVSLPGKRIEEPNFKPLGGGTGTIGLPGDYTPPSQFVRAVAFAKSARPTESGAETMYESFRILDSFHVPFGSGRGSGKQNENRRDVQFDDLDHGLRHPTSRPEVPYDGQPTRTPGGLEPNRLGGVEVMNSAAA